MFQQSLDINPRAVRLYAGLYPSGGRRDPCDVKCTACTYTATALNWTAAVHLAIRP